MTKLQEYLENNKEVEVLNKEYFRWVVDYIKSTIEKDGRAFFSDTDPCGYEKDETNLNNMKKVTALYDVVSSYAQDAGIEPYLVTDEQINYLVDFAGEKFTVGRHTNKFLGTYAQIHGDYDKYGNETNIVKADYLLNGIFDKASLARMQ